MFYQALEASGGFLIIYQLQLNIKSEAQQKKLKTVRGSYTDLDLSTHAKKGPKNLVRHSL
jgi:hypothetical protein